MPTWDIAQCNTVQISRRFGGTYCVSAQGRKLQLARSCEAWVNFQTSHDVICNKVVTFFICKLLRFVCLRLFGIKQEFLFEVELRTAGGNGVSI